MISCPRSQPSDAVEVTNFQVLISQHENLFMKIRFENVN